MVNLGPFRSVFDFMGPPVGGVVAMIAVTWPSTAFNSVHQFFWWETPDIGSFGLISNFESSAEWYGDWWLPPREGFGYVSKIPSAATQVAEFFTHVVEPASRGLFSGSIFCINLSAASVYMTEEELIQHIAFYAKQIQNTKSIFSEGMMTIRLYHNIKEFEIERDLEFIRNGEYRVDGYTDHLQFHDITTNIFQWRARIVQHIERTALPPPVHSVFSDPPVVDIKSYTKYEPILYERQLGRIIETPKEPPKD